MFLDIEASLSTIYQSILASAFLNPIGHVSQYTGGGSGGSCNDHRRCIYTSPRWNHYRFDSHSDSLKITRGGSVLIKADRIQAIYASKDVPKDLLSSKKTKVIDVTDKIITPGFVDTHRHGWQTGFKTIASNTSLAEYFMRYSEFVAGSVLDADDVYIGQLAGLYDAINAGVTTSLDHAHHTWSNKTAEAGLKASIDSGARVFWSYAFHAVEGFPIPEQFANFRDIATKAEFEGTSTNLGIAYDSFGPDPNVKDVKEVVKLAK